MEARLSDALVIRDDDGGIATLTLNAPARLNALSEAMIAALSATFAAIAADETVRVVILRGGARAFSAGHDLREMQGARGDADGGLAYWQGLFARCGALMQAITALPQPVIAEVRGLATAAGCQLVASCDLVVAAEEARFGVNGIDVGLFCSTPMVALTRKVPPAVAFELLVTGAFLSAARAREVGLVNQVVPAGELAGATRALAGRIAAKLPLAIRLGKAAFHEQMGLSRAEAYARMGLCMAKNMATPETAEGIAAFLEKRRPVWG